MGGEPTPTDVRERALRLAEDASKPPTFQQVRAALNEVGITAARSALRATPDLIANARVALREAQNVEKQARDAYDTAVNEAEWLLAGNFEVRSNKSWLVRDEKGEPISEDDQRSMAADERKAWISHHAALTPDVRKAIAALAAAERNRLTAADDMAVAETRLTVAKHDVDAAAAELRFLALTITN